MIYSNFKIVQMAGVVRSEKARGATLADAMQADRQLRNKKAIILSCLRDLEQQQDYSFPLRECAMASVYSFPET